MTKLEKVLHGLSSCGNDYGIPNICEVTECPYREYKAWCVHELAHDASVLIAELSKKREPLEPVIINGEPECAECLYELRKDADSYCPCCGRKIKWE